MFLLMIFEGKEWMQMNLPGMEAAYWKARATELGLKATITEVK